MKKVKLKNQDLEIEMPAKTFERLVSPNTFEQLILQKSRAENVSVNEKWVLRFLSLVIKFFLMAPRIIHIVKWICLIVQSYI